MRKVIIGHRGVGKTSFLKRHLNLFPNTEHFDLDEAIEKKAGMRIQDFFVSEGEAAFRQLEQEVFAELARRTHFVISVGAGFDIQKIAPDIEVLWLKRVTDSGGRIFLNRPRLNSELPPLEESKIRYVQRDPLFSVRADEIYHMPEGLTDASSTSAFEIEKKILLKEFLVRDAYYILTERDLSCLGGLTKTYTRIELRTDLLSPTQIDEILKTYPGHSWLVSVRTECDPAWLKKLTGRALIDCDRKLGMSIADIFSSHADSVSEGIAQLAKTESMMGQQPHLKLSPLIQNFEELIRGYEWQQADPANRSFLPRSLSGRWLWYRQHAKYLQRLNYIKGRIEVADQPSLYQWLTLPEAKPLRWGAVLGTPVHFSKSPLEQQEFAVSLKSYFTAVDLNAKELAENILFLHHTGLTHAAVTSPLKEQLFKMADQPTPQSAKFKSANTLLIREKNLIVGNTDVEGFKDLVSKIPQGATIAVWGGGGTLEMMKSVLPEADYFSSQTGELRTHQKPRPLYDVLIWAAPRLPQTKWPDGILFNEVVDLNYAEHSMGLEFAANRKIRYTSGQAMFEAQAAEQRRFWKDMETASERK